MTAIKFLAVAAVCLSTALGASAQRNKTIKEIMDMKGVESTFVSKVYRDSDDKEGINLNPSLEKKGVKGTYLIDIDYDKDDEETKNNKALIKKVYGMLEDMVSNSKYQLLMRTKDDDEVTYMYGIPKGSKGYEEQIMISKSDDELSIIYYEW